jgi:hypothetical protein
VRKSLLAGMAVALTATGLAVYAPWYRASSMTRNATAKPVALAAPRKARPILVPNIKPGEPWTGVWHQAKPDAVLPEGLRFEVCDGIITGVVSAPGPEISSLVGSRYVVGDLDATDVTMALWRFLDLELAKPDGSVAKLAVARPLWWLEETGAKAGATIDLAIHEAGIEGSARVLTVGPCPVDSRDNPPGGQIVIGKIEHQNAVALDLVFNGETDKPLGVTANHPIYSEDRDDWVPAGELKVGEQARTVDGVAKLTSKSQRPGRHTVHNMEVHRSHSYYVSHLGVLAHNTGIGCPKLPAAGKEIARTPRKGADKIDFLFNNRNDAMNWAAKRLGTANERMHDAAGRWIGWKNAAGDKVYWGHGDWYTGPGKSKFPHLNFDIAGESGHLFLGDKITNTGLWPGFSSLFGL